jgi:hypothetical protein
MKNSYLSVLSQKDDGIWNSTLTETVNIYFFKEKKDEQIQKAREILGQKMIAVKSGDYICGFFTPKEIGKIGEFWDAIARHEEGSQDGGGFSNYWKTMNKLKNCFTIDFGEHKDLREEILKGLEKTIDKRYMMLWRSCKNARLYLKDIIGVKSAKSLAAQNSQLCGDQMTGKDKNDM